MRDEIFFKFSDEFQISNFRFQIENRIKMFIGRNHISENL